MLTRRFSHFPCVAAIRSRECGGGENLCTRKSGANGLEAAHVIAVPVAQDDMRDRLLGERPHLGDDRLAHGRASAGVEEDNTLAVMTKTAFPSCGSSNGSCRMAAQTPGAGSSHEYRNGFASALAARIRMHAQILGIPASYTA
jgi:hypothetical protein